MASLLLSFSLFILTVGAHMQLHYPSPFGAENNPHRTDSADPYLHFPYNCCGPNAKWTYPCRGYLKLLGTPQGAPVVEWEAGSSQNWSLTGIGNHYGGSCQVGFSIDKGKTFQVATSYEGNCPHRHGGMAPFGQTFNFTVPVDMPTGDAVFAWTWFNREQEFNMNCASVTITKVHDKSNEQLSAQVLSTTTASTPEQLKTYTTDGCTCTCSCTKPPIHQALAHHYKRAGGINNHHHHHHLGGGGAHSSFPSKMEKRAFTPYSQRPTMLVADTGNGCLTPRTSAEVKFPHPGPDVVKGDGEYPLELPTPAEACGY